MGGAELHVVLGAGPLGIATAEALLRRGRRVTLVNRSGAAAPAGAQVVRADLYDAASVRRATAGAAAVYQCAQPRYSEWTSKFEPLQTAIIAGVAGTGARLIVAENLYMYGAVAGPLHEDLPYAAHTRKGRVRARMAEQVAEAHRSGRLPTASARGSDFYGPGVLGSTLGERVFQPALAGRTAQAVGRLDQPHSYTYIGDFGEALAILGERDEALGRHWHVPTAPARTQAELIAMVYAELGAPPKMVATGRLLMALGGLFIPEARETVEMLYEFERPFIMAGERFTAAFGLRPTPPEEGIARTVAWYRAHQALAPAAA
ncbi:MAG TPA: NAD-dependent epimerase/dehydratase family protein [Chloroflexaceae bacterium]|nr:NAD-dependent epimerase/dehydratase family protein [Chloroflexaceae bacterium]